MRALSCCPSTTYPRKKKFVRHTSVGRKNFFYISHAGYKNNINHHFLKNKKSFIYVHNIYLQIPAARWVNDWINWLNHFHDLSSTAYISLYLKIHKFFLLIDIRDSDRSVLYWIFFLWNWLMWWGIENFNALLIF